MLSLHKGERAKILSQNFRSRRFHPTIQNGGVYRPKIDGMDQITLIELTERRVFPVKPGSNDSPGNEHRRCRAVICPFASILGDSAAKLAEGHDQYPVPDSLGG